MVVLIGAYVGYGMLFPSYTEKQIIVKVGNGATINEICAENYKGDIRSFEEFVWQVRKDNDLEGNKLQNLQAGQRLYIVKKVGK